MLGRNDTASRWADRRFALWRSAGRLAATPAIEWSARGVVPACT